MGLATLQCIYIWRWLFKLKKAIGKEGRIPKHENSEGHRESMKKFCDNGLENNIGAKLSNE